MAALSKYARQRIVHLKRRRFHNFEVVEMLKRENISTTASTVRRFYNRFCDTGSIERRPGSGRPTLLSVSMLNSIDQMMHGDNETTTAQIRTHLHAQGMEMSVSTILRGCRLLGWTYRGSAYCQLIRDVNKEKRLQWARDHLNDEFTNVVWTDETTVQLETHKRFCYRKKGVRPHLKPCAKHPVKVHVWAGIGWHGPTEICIFEGKMDATLYTQILERALLPTLRWGEYRGGHRFMQDNDPKTYIPIGKGIFCHKWSKLVAHTSRKPWCQPYWEPLAWT